MCVLTKGKAGRGDKSTAFKYGENQRLYVQLEETRRGSR